MNDDDPVHRDRPHPVHKDRAWLRLLLLEQWHVRCWGLRGDRGGKVVGVDLGVSVVVVDLVRGDADGQTVGDGTVGVDDPPSRATLVDVVTFGIPVMTNYTRSIFFSFS